MRPEIEKTLKLEGGATYTADPDDPGGGTRFGISKKNHPELDIQHLTLDQAMQVYETEYWKPLHLDQYKYAPFRWKLFDIAVNQGVGTATAFLAILQAKKDTFDAVRELSELQVKRYANLVYQSPRLVKYIRGWINRAFDYGLELNQIN